MKYLTVASGALLGILPAVASTSASAQGRPPVDPGFGVRPPPVDPGFGVRPPPQRPVDPGFGVRPPVDPGYGVSGPGGCYRCPPPRNYDSTEVAKVTKDVDHSRVIETQSVVPSKRVIETNHLIIRENETRNVGVVQHNHTIVEKELVLTKRNVDTKHVNTVVNLVEHKYNTERKRVVEERDVPGHNRDLHDCNCDKPVPTPYPVQAYGMAPKYVNTRY